MPELMMSLGGKLRREEVLWLLGSISALFRMPFDAALVSQQFPPPYNITTFHEIARTLALKTASCSTANIDWQKLPLPAVAFLKQGAEPASAAIENASLAASDDNASEDLAGELPPKIAVLILKTDGQNLVYFRCGTQTPETTSVEEAVSQFESDLILIGKESTSATGEDDNVPGFATKKKEFGFGWFVPELLKHKNIWRDVLLASLAIQLVGLTTPLVTQVIIDKVVAHQTQNTLLVLGIALIMFMLFTSAMTWLRQYLVLHTGNRIDAVLGSEVFRHLLRLPLPYFEQRPTARWWRACMALRRSVSLSPARPLPSSLTYPSC